MRRSKKQTFIVEILDCQKQTWQGRIHWIQEDRKMSFRSVMEMLHLMESALARDADERQEKEKV